MVCLQKYLVLFVILLALSQTLFAWSIQRNTVVKDEENVDYFAELEALKSVNSTQKGYFCAYPGVPCYKGVYLI